MMATLHSEYNTDAKFMTFWTTLSNSYELPDDLKPDFFQALKVAGFYEHITTLDPKPVDPTIIMIPQKRVTGYNVFMRHKSAELEATDSKRSDRMKQVAQLWQQLSPQDQDQFNQMALTESQILPKTVPKPRKPRHKSGYQLYMADIMPTIKADLNIVSDDRMTVIGNRWSLLPESEKNRYQILAQNQHKPYF